MAGEWLNALMQAPDAGQAFMQSFDRARQQVDQREIAKMRMREHQEDRRSQMEDRQAEQRKQQLAEARDRLAITARLLDSATDPVSYQQARQAAAGIPGFDMASVPEQYDPNWVQQTKMQARALQGQVEQELMAVAPGTTVIDKRTGEKVFTNPRPPRYIPVQAGGKLVLDPASIGGDLPPDAGDDEWETIGGPAVNQPGGFR